MAMKLSRALGGRPQFWLTLQNNWEISQLDGTHFDGIEHIAAWDAAVEIEKGKKGPAAVNVY